MYKYLLIDWDNTIWDLRENCAQSLAQCYKEYGLEEFFGSPQKFEEEYHRANDALWAQYRRAEIDRPYLVSHRFRNAFLSVGYSGGKLPDNVNQAYLRHVESLCALVPHAQETLARLREMGHTLIIISNGFREVQMRKIRNSGIEQLFSHVILSDQAGALKPSARFFDYALSSTGATPMQSIVIGDDPEADIAGAVSYGLRSVYFNRLGKDCPYACTHEIKDLRELIGIVGARN